MCIFLKQTDYCHTNDQTCLWVKGESLLRECGSSGFHALPSLVWQGRRPAVEITKEAFWTCGAFPDTGRKFRICPSGFQLSTYSEAALFQSVVCWITRWQPGWKVNEATWTRMAVNLSKNGAALVAAYKEVVDTKSDTNWWAHSDDRGGGTHPDITVIISWIVTSVPSLQGAVYLWGEQ